MPRRIVIGLDDSPEGADAVMLGGVLAEVLAAKPIVLSALPYPRYLVSAASTATISAALEEDTRERFEAARGMIGSLDPDMRAVANPSPARALYGVASDEDALAVVVGSHHRGALGRVKPGSAGRALLHGGPCAVAVAPRGYAKRPEHSFVRIGVAFDGSAESWNALETGIALVARLHGTLLVLTAAMPPQYGYGSLALVGDGEVQNTEQLAKSRSLRLAAERIPREVDAATRLLNGDPVHVLTEETEELDLIILGSRGYGPLRRTLLGSVAAGVMTSATCPALVLPRAAGSDPLRLKAARPPSEVSSAEARSASGGAGRSRLASPGGSAHSARPRARR